MKSKLLLAITAGLFFFSPDNKAQVSAYTFSQSVTTYGAPNTGTVVGINFQDDDINTVPLPFTFVFNGNGYSSIDVCSNGYMSFNINSLVGNEYQPISDLGTTQLLSPFGQDLIMVTACLGDLTVGSNSITNCSSTAGFSVGDVIFDWNGDFTANPVITAIVGNIIVLNLNSINTSLSTDIINYSGAIEYSVSGTNPNRVFEIEYSKFMNYNAVYDETVSFKVRLYETTNRIEFLYGTCVPDWGASSEVGIKGLVNSDFNSRKVTSPTAWNLSTAATLPSDLCDFDFGTSPLLGLSYMWTPPTCTVPVLAITANNSITCEGESVILTPSGATTYTWLGGGPTVQQTVTINAPTTFTLLGANLTCTSSITFTQGVAPKPILNVTGSASICSGQSATLTGNGATSYTWTNGPATAQNIVSPTSSTIYTLSGSNGTCTSSTSVNVNVTSSPTITISQSTVACQGVAVDLIASGASSYSWANSGPNSATLSVSVNTSNTYTVFGSTGTCTSSATISNSFIPAPMLTPSSAQSTLCVGEKTTFSLTGVTTGLTFNWSNGANTTTSAVATAVSAPSVTLSVIATNGTCQATYSFMQPVSECTGLNEASNMSNFISAYPNPFNSSLTLRNTKAEDLSVSIIDALGKVVLTVNVKAEANETISTETLKSGLYFISVKGSNGTYTEKLIKE